MNILATNEFIYPFFWQLSPPALTGYPSSGQEFEKHDFRQINDARLLSLKLLEKERKNNNLLLDSIVMILTN